MFSFKNKARIMPYFKYTGYTIIFYVADYSLYPDPDFKSQSDIIVSGLTALILLGDWLSYFL
jgi:hypothetical protein